ncbi:unnamed protein product [marine sediment metagenome]|uniref:Uncharacterized protein n=1 Tax=marine sediment metagenome TaxID=412755 RepID=X1B9T5_9ZZZZ
MIDKDKLSKIIRMITEKKIVIKKEPKPKLSPRVFIPFEWEQSLKKGDIVFGRYNGNSRIGEVEKNPKNSKSIKVKTLNTSSSEIILLFKTNHARHSEFNNSIIPLS